MTSASFRIIATYPSACQGHSALESALDKEYEPALGLGNLCPPSSAIVTYKFTLLVADSFHSTECRYSQGLLPIQVLQSRRAEPVALVPQRSATSPHNPHFMALFSSKQELKAFWKEGDLHVTAC